MKGLTRHTLLVGYDALAEVRAWECEDGHRVATPTEPDLPRQIRCTFPSSRSLMQCGKPAKLKAGRR